MNIIPVNKLKSSVYGINLAADGDSYINKAYVGDELALVRFSKYPRLAVDQSSLSFAIEGGSLVVSVFSNASWSAETSNSWMTIASASGYENGSFTVTADENDTGEDRFGSITVRAFTTDASTALTISVSQKLVEYLLYFSNGVYDNTNVAGYELDVNYIPTEYTKCVVGLNLQKTDGNMVFSNPPLVGSAKFYRLFTYSNNQMMFDCPTDYSNGRNIIGYTFGTYAEFEVGVDAGHSYITNLTTQQTARNSSTNTYDFGTNHLRFWYDSASLAKGTQIYKLDIWENNVKVREMRPAIVNEVVGMYDNLNGVFYPSTGTNPLTPGYA